MEMQGLPIPWGPQSQGTVTEVAMEPGQGEGNWVLLMKVWLTLPCSAPPVRVEAVKWNPAGFWFSVHPSVVGLLCH